VTINAINNYNIGEVIQFASVNGAGLASTSTSFVDITSATITITPTSASSNILIIASFASVNALGVNSSMYFQCLRGATVVPGGPPSGVYAGNAVVTAEQTNAANHFVAIDSPATTGATTYKFQQRSSTGTTITTYNLHMIAMEIGA